MFHFIHFVLVMTVLMVSSVATAQQYVDESSDDDISTRFDTNFAHTHDRGFYTRLSAGVLYRYSTVVPPALGQEDEDDKGWIFGYDVNLGWLPTSQLAVHVSQWSDVGAKRGHIAGGLGVTYYFNESQNWFVSSMAGPSFLYDEAPDLKFGDQGGLSAQVQLGTGWWIAPDWVLGCVLSASGEHIDLDADGIYSTGWQAGLRFSLSLN